MGWIFVHLFQPFSDLLNHYMPGSPETKHTHQTAGNIDRGRWSGCPAMPIFLVLRGPAPRLIPDMHHLLQNLWMDAQHAQDAFAILTKLTISITTGVFGFYSAR